MKRGLVIKSIGSSYRVKTEEGVVLSCTLKGKLRLKGVKTTNPITVGDYVSYEVESVGTGVIQSVEERKNYIIRKSTNLSRQYHVIAANIDQAVLVASLTMPRTTRMFIDRFLVTAEAYRIPVLLVFNKQDLYGQEDLQEYDFLKIVYSALGYSCLDTSAETGHNLGLLSEALKDKVSLVSGNSGVGKSTLINKIDGHLDLKTATISDYHKTGRHTTTFSEMFDLTFGGSIIDTPGIKGFGLIDMEKEELFHFFPELFYFAKECQYYNCTHVHEPGCGVKKAVDLGKIAGFRYENYLGMYYDDENKHR